MAISEFETKRCEQLVKRYIDKRRPPPDIRPELDLGYRIQGQSVEIFEIRPVWRGAPGEKMEQPVAKTTFVKSRGVWKVFWQRADLKWHSYQPASEVRRIEDFLELVDRDEFGCFYG
ncbi:MAG: DUF3024 domain-containing protein [Gammaproteobacteria bacterium]|nr:DUF3024 domain-containing protein [Gammaproteobacteria bacterium]